MNSKFFKEIDTVLVDSSTTNVREISDYIYTHHPVISKTSRVIVRYPAEYQLSLRELNQDNSLDWSDVYHRSSKASLFVLSSVNFSHKLYKYTSGSDNKYFSESKEIDLKIIKDHEVEMLLKETNSIYSISGKQKAFHLPSGKYVKQFLRVGNIQSYKLNTEILFFWALPFLKKCEAIVGETWTISSICLNFSRLLNRYCNRSVCSVQYVSQYHNGSTNTTLQLENICNTFRNKKVLFIVSACSSGKLINTTKQVFSRFQINVEYLSLFNTGSTLTPSIYKLILEEHDPQETLTDIIQIDPTTYYPQIRPPEKIDIEKPPRDHRDLGFNAIQKYKNLGIFKCHVWNTRTTHIRKSKRHHAYFIDILPLIEDDKFAKETSIKLRKITRNRTPIAIITPKHKAGRAFGKLAARILKRDLGVELEPHHINRIERKTKLKELIRKSNAADVILIVDDVFITGSRLIAYDDQLRKSGFKGMADYLCAFARPSKEDDFDEISRRRSFVHADGNSQEQKTDFVEKLILPNWNEKKCPWCIENDVLSNIFGSIIIDSAGNIPSSFGKRAGQLAHEWDGINNLFFTLRDQQLSPLSPKSAFITEPCSESDIVFIFAHILQLTRISFRRKTFNEGYFINPDSFFKDITDEVLSAAILKSIGWNELHGIPSPDLEKMENWIKDLLNSRDRNFALGEVLIANLSGKLPFVNTKFADFFDQHGVFTFSLQELL